MPQFMSNNAADGYKYYGAATRVMKLNSQTAGDGGVSGVMNLAGVFLRRSLAAVRRRLKASPFVYSYYSSFPCRRLIGVTVLTPPGIGADRCQSSEKW
jgi:hypothetical protein